MREQGKATTRRGEFFEPAEADKLENLSHKRQKTASHGDDDFCQTWPPDKTPLHPSLKPLTMLFTPQEMPRKTLADMLGRLAVALSAGIDLRRAWTLESTRVPAVWRPRMQKVAQALAEGNPLAESLDRSRRFPRRVLEVIAVGEATGNTSEVLERLAGQLDDEARDGFAAAARGSGFLVWAAVAGLITLIVFRIFSSYLGMIQNAANGR